MGDGIYRGAGLLLCVTSRVTSPRKNHRSEAYVVDDVDNVDNVDNIDNIDDVSILVLNILIFYAYVHIYLSF